MIKLIDKEFGKPIWLNERFIAGVEQVHGEDTTIVWLERDGYDNGFFVQNHPDNIIKMIEDKER